MMEISWLAKDICLNSEIKWVRWDESYPKDITFLQYGLGGIVVKAAFLMIHNCDPEWTVKKSLQDKWEKYRTGNGFWRFSRELCYWSIWKLLEKFVCWNCQAAIKLSSTGCLLSRLKHMSWVHPVLEGVHGLAVLLLLEKNPKMKKIPRVVLSFLFCDCL